MTIALPDKIQMKMAMYGDGANGAAFQIARNDDFSVQCDAVRERRGKPFVEHWSHDHMPDQTFKTYAELVKAATQVMPVKFQPVLVDIHEPLPGSSGKCFLCHGEWKWTVVARTGWRPGDVIHCSSCDRCLEATKADPLASQQARRDYVKSLPSPSEILEKARLEPRDPECPFG